MQSSWLETVLEILGVFLGKTNQLNQLYIFAEVGRKFLERVLQYSNRLWDALRGIVFESGSFERGCTAHWSKQQLGRKGYFTYGIENKSRGEDLRQINYSDL